MINYDIQQWKKEQNKEQAWWKRNYKNRYKSSILNVHCCGNPLATFAVQQNYKALHEAYQIRRHGGAEIVTLMRKMGYE